MTLRIEGRARWPALILLCLGELMIVLDTTIVNVALPSIKADLGFTETSLVWVVNAYMLTFGGCLLLGGRLGDLYGHRRLFLAGITLFTVASLACGLANTQGLLVAARAVQGVGGAVVSAVALSLIMNLFTEPGERARAMAEMTRSGYVYIISNVGSFGEDVVKIGLTRRLDPDDRVRELGDASVPFSFDTHAMIYSDAAPALEFALHKEFADRRINMSNFRKEFFRVSLDEVEEAVARLAPDASFFKDREAQEWHETMARRNVELLDLQSAAAKSLPASI